VGKIPAYILGIIILLAVGFLSGYLIRSGKNIATTNERLSELEGLAQSIGDSQRAIESGLDSVRDSVDGVRESTDGLKERIGSSERRSARIEEGIDRLSAYTVSSLEAVGRLVAGNTDAQGRSDQIKGISGGIGEILDGIERGNGLDEE
jgi:methyl-accepting chemotaxis protein